MMLWSVGEKLWDEVVGLGWLEFYWVLIGWRHVTTKCCKELFYHEGNYFFPPRPFGSDAPFGHRSSGTASSVCVCVALQPSHKRTVCVRLYSTALLTFLTRRMFSKVIFMDNHR